MHSSNLDVIEEAQTKPIKTVITKKRPITGSVRVNPLPPVVMKDMLAKENQVNETEKPKLSKEELEAHMKYLESLSKPKKQFVPKKVIEDTVAVPIEFERKTRYSKPPAPKMAPRPSR
jgi:hypothetical protein